jgi:hypothetical protein
VDEDMDDFNETNENQTNVRASLAPDSLKYALTYRKETNFTVSLIGIEIYQEIQ